MYGLDGDFVVGVGSEGTLGFGVVLRGPDAGNVFGSLDGTTSGLFAVGADISVSLEGMWIFYDGDIKNFNASMLEGFRTELSLALDLGIDIGATGFIGEEDPFGGRVIGIGGSFGVGIPVFGWLLNGNLNYGETIIWGK